MGSLSSKIFRTSKMASSAEIQQFIKEVISQDKVVVFSKSYCPYCTIAKDVFSMVKQPIKVIELDQRDDGDVIQNNLATMTGFRTVPQVFINGNCVGGGSDVKALHASGKLEPMLIDDLGKVVGKHWMQSARDRELWRSLGKAYVQQWTTSG